MQSDGSSSSPWALAATVEWTPPPPPPSQPIPCMDGPEQSNEGPTPTPQPQQRRSTLAERASRDRSFNLGLSMETIHASSREAFDSAPGMSGSDSAGQTTAHFRGWHVTEEGRNIPTSCEGSIKVMSYNILASRYVTTDRYPVCPTWALAESYRAKQIMHEVSGCDPDIIAFQEMSLDMFSQEDLLGDLLRKAGYEGHHVVITGRSGEPCHFGGASGHDVRGEYEGVAMFFKLNRFQLLEMSPIRFNLVAECDKTLLPHERGRLQVASHNVAISVALLEHVTTAGTGGGVVIAGSMHTLWDGIQKPEGQAYQMHHLIKQVEELKSMYEHIGETSVFIVGDFNAELNSFCLSYALMNSLGSTCSSSLLINSTSPTPVQGSIPMASPLLPPTTPDLGVPAPSAFQFQSPTQLADWVVRPRTHSLFLRDAYAAYCSRFPSKVSAVNPSTNGEGKVIDHILYDNAACVCVAVGRLGEKAEIPTRSIPSDHYPIAATFVPVHRVVFLDEPLTIVSEGEDEDAVMSGVY